MRAKHLILCLIAVVSLSSNAYSQEKKPHSPKKATILSSVLPGAGQVYNKQTWKLPIIYAGIDTATGLAINNYKGAQRFKKEYILRANGETEGRNPQYENYPDQSIYNLYYAYQKNMELSIFVGIGVYLLNIVDAMVYGHLFDFDISPDLSLNISPIYQPTHSFGQGCYGLGLTLSF